MSQNEEEDKSQEEEGEEEASGSRNVVYAIENTPSSSRGPVGHPEQPPQPLDEETKEFLQFWLKTGAKTDVVDILRENIEKIKRNPENIREAESALTTLSEYVGEIDFANDFYKIGGFGIFKICLECEEESLRWRCAELIADLAQNNPFCQEKLVESGIIPRLINMMERDNCQKVSIKALYAISCIIRDFENGLNEFLNNDGCSVLLRALQSGLYKLTMKTAFLLSSLIQQRPQLQEELTKMGFVEQLTQLLAEHSEQIEEITEHLLFALLLLVRENCQSEEILRRGPIDFKQLLDSIINQCNTHDEFREELSYAQQLSAILYSDTEQESVDK